MTNIEVLIGAYLLVSVCILSVFIILGLVSDNWGRIQRFFHR